MENGRPDPGVDANRSEAQVVGLHGMPVRYSFLDGHSPANVVEHVQERERDRRRLLHAREPPEWPFAVVLVDAVSARNGEIGYGVHALVLAVVVTRPACEAKGEGHGGI